MRIVVLGNRDLATCLALNSLLPVLLAEHQVQLIVSARVGKQQSRPAPLQALQFAEQALFNDIVFPLAESLPPESRGDCLGFADLAALTGEELCEFNHLNQAPELEQFIAMQPDLVISIRYGVILKQPVLDVPRFGVINLHSGRLPDYRGVMASFWALLNGDESLGTSLHYIDDASIDTGRIIATTSLPVDKSHSYLWHVAALYEEGCARILDAVRMLASGEQPEAVQQAPGGDYYSLPNASDLEKFHQQGWQLFTPQDLQMFSKRFIKV